MNHVWKCIRCEEFHPADKIVNHLRLMHPSDDAAPEFWPDGEPVVFEDADEFFL
jgi:hypothetical protein